MATASATSLIHLRPTTPRQACKVATAAAATQSFSWKLRPGRCEVLHNTHISQSLATFPLFCLSIPHIHKTIHPFRIQFIKHHTLSSSRPLPTSPAHNPWRTWESALPPQAFQIPASLLPGTASKAMLQSSDELTCKLFVPYQTVLVN